MKPLVFMCMSVAGLLAGLYLGFNTEPNYRSASMAYELRTRERDSHRVFYAIGGAVVGAGFGWLACNIEKFGPPKL
jgi:hypothetical protein